MFGDTDIVVLDLAPGAAISRHVWPRRKNPENGRRGGCPAGWWRSKGYRVAVNRGRKRLADAPRCRSKNFECDMAMIRGPFFGRDRLPAPKSEVGLFVPVGEVFPGMTADESTLLSLLQGLSRDDTLFMAARLNTIISGSGDFDVQPRQQQALSTMCTTAQIDRVNDLTPRR
jgi:hypothetical protein